ncbi:MAG: hypothetical protein JNK83_05255 [Rhizobiales bacterium]|nr:hypothetical protein [Hyphomicrobiales bacterium]
MSVPLIVYPHVYALVAGCSDQPVMHTAAVARAPRVAGHRQMVIAEGRNLIDVLGHQMTCH